MSQGVVYTIFKQLTGHESLGERFPTWQEYQFFAHDVVSLQHLRSAQRFNPQVRTYVIGDGEYIMMLNGTQVHMAYCGHYQLWGLVYAQQVVTGIRENFEGAFRKEALRFLGHNLAGIQRAQVLNTHFRAILGEGAEDEIAKATEQAQAEHLERERQRRDPVGTSMSGLFASALGLRNLLSGDPLAFYQDLGGFSYHGGPDLSGLDD